MLMAMIRVVAVSVVVVVVFFSPVVLHQLGPSVINEYKDGQH